MEQVVTNNFQLFVPIELKRVKGYAFVDTGAAFCVINESFAQEFPRVGISQTSGALGTTKLETCQIDQINFLGERFSGVEAAIQADLGVHPPTLPAPVIIKVGVDLLYHKPLYLNFAEKQMGFLEAVPVEWERAGQAVDLRFVKGLATFDGIDLGKHKLKSLFDTGAGWSLLNARSFDRLESQLIEQEAMATRDAAGVVQQIPVYKHPALTMEGAILGESRFLLIDLAPVESKLGVPVDLVLGFDVIAQHNWVIDRMGKRLLRNGN